MQCTRPPSWISGKGKGNEERGSETERGSGKWEREEVQGGEERRVKGREG